MGIDGFRCDAAYKVPAELWEFLISRSKAKYPDCIYLAETLGCTPEETLRIVNTGFDYMFNSSKYWDFKEPWLLKQYNQTREIIKQLASEAMGEYIDYYTEPIWTKDDDQDIQDIDE